MLSAPAYGLGAVELVVIVAAATLGARRLRTRLLPGWSGSPAWLADAVAALALLYLPAELLGAFGAFEEVPYLVLVVALGAGLRLGVRPADQTAAAAPPAPPCPRWIVIVAAIVAGIVVAHWSNGARLSLGQGMTGFDSTWYHGPFAAGFVQSGDTFDLQLIAPQYLSWFYPQNSELADSIGILAFGRDLLSPLLNLGWLAGCLLAAWCIGRPYGAGPISLVGAALVLDSGVLADQAGEARNDIVAIFFLLAAVAILVNAWASAPRELPLGALILTGLAAGLAAGTKVNFLAPAGAMLIGVVALLPAGRRLRGTVAFGLPLLAGCGYWYLRNLVHAGNPLPWIKQAGPIALPSPDQEIGGREQHGVLEYLLDGSVWSDWFLPGFEEGLGDLWGFVVLLGVAALLLIAFRGDRAGRVLGVVGLVTVAAWLVAPASAEGPEGTPLGFVSGLRYLAPALVIGLALLPTLLPAGEKRPRITVLGAYLLAFPFAVASAESWPRGYLAGAIVVGAAVSLVVFLVGSGRLGHLRPGFVAASVAAGVLLAAAGYAVQRDYLRDRYAEVSFTTPGLNAAFEWAHDLADARIATTTTRQYPLWGADLTNHVRFVGIERPNGGYVRPGGCEEWRRALNAGHFEYVVTSLDRFEPGQSRFPREAGWTEGDPAARVILRRAPAVVFELSGPLDPRGC